MTQLAVIDVVYKIPQPKLLKINILSTILIKDDKNKNRMCFSSFHIFATTFNQCMLISIKPHPKKPGFFGHAKTETQGNCGSAKVLLF